VVGSVSHPVLLAPTPVGQLSMAELAVQARALMRTVDAARYDWPRHARLSQREPRDYLRTRYNRRYGVREGGPR
jgi:hypothetical protein